ncbi:MAG TPA: peptidyl-prolyl cis-trans isomerase [Polyangia bacterium]|jgi:hypothetical protein
MRPALERIARLSVAGALVALVAAGTACRPSVAGAGIVVARSGELSVSGDDLLAAARALPDGPVALADPKRVQALAEDILFDEALAKEARASVPGAVVRARAAARERAVRALIEGAPLDQGLLEAYYRQHLDDYRIPDEVRLAEMSLPSCEQAAKVREEIAAGKVTFAAAAMRDSIDRSAALASAKPDWRPVDRLPLVVRKALDKLTQPGELSPPVSAATAEVARPASPLPLPGVKMLPPRLGEKRPAMAPASRRPGECLLLQLVERRPGRTRTFAEVRDEVRTRAEVTARGFARQNLLQKLGFTAASHVLDGGLSEALSDRDDVDENRTVVAVGGERITVGDLRAMRPTRVVGPGGRQGLAVRLAEDLALWQEARRRGLDQLPEVRGAERTQLALEARARLDAGLQPHELPAAEVRAVYDQSLGDYTEPARVRVSALVSRERAKAERWAARLRLARFRTDEFERLLQESENEAARRKAGEVGWIDSRSTNFPESFKRAALLLPRPGEVAGPVEAAGLFHVLLCRDRVPEKVKSFEEVEAEIRARLSTAKRRDRTLSKTNEVRASLKVAVDRDALRKLQTKAR